MDNKKIEKLKALGGVGITGEEIASVKGRLAAGEDVCITVCAWIIKKAASTGSCAAGEAALTGIFTLAEVVFFPEGEEILIPLEVVVDGAWGATCSEIGVAVLGKQADKWAKEWCSKI